MIAVNEAVKSWDNSNSENDVILIRRHRFSPVKIIKNFDCFNMISYSLDFISACKNT